MTTTVVDLQQQSTQCLIDNQYHIMNSRNELWMMWLKPIQVEYYSIENQKSYSNTLYIVCIFIHCDFLDMNGL